MTEKQPLVSVGIPTYNNPEGLKRTLENITKQTYKNLEIIVSDNCSDDKIKITNISKEYTTKDKRIKFYRQKENKGPIFNFEFVLKKATGKYFMWCADDYVWNNNLIEKLLTHSISNVLVFPDFNLNQKKNFFRSVYGTCETGTDYLFAWIRNGAGYPVYGMYNLKLMQEHNLIFSFDEKLSYFNEGTFLHKVFLSQKIMFISDALISVDVNPPNASKYNLFIDFPKYAKKVFKIHLTCSLKLKYKIKIIFILIRLYNKAQNTFLLNLLKSNEKSILKIILYHILHPFTYLLGFPKNNALMLRNFIGSLRKKLLAQTLKSAIVLLFSSFSF